MQTLAQENKELRQLLKSTFPECKFSVTGKHFAGGSSTTVALMEAPKAVMEEAQDCWTDGYAQLNEYQLQARYHDTFESNGCKLTRYGWYLWKHIVNFVLGFGTYNTRYTFIHFEIGKWDKPYRVTASPLTPCQAE